ncbi:hypothetical protein TWF751_010599 [Orbilia oligospora]|nr:hypothetical protein TWF751_010599 [Orbilia oligospora]
MSRASKLTLGLVTAVTGLIVVAVHNTQVTEREAMHQGVVRDEERQRLKRERALDFEMSAKLREEYEKVQPVSNSGDKPKRYEGMQPVDSSELSTSSSTPAGTPIKIRTYNLENWHPSVFCT